MISQKFSPSVDLKKRSQEARSEGPNYVYSVRMRGKRALAALAKTFPQQRKLEEYLPLVIIETTYCST